MGLDTWLTHEVVVFLVALVVSGLIIQIIDQAVARIRHQRAERRALDAWCHARPFHAWYTTRLEDDGPGAPAGRSRRGPARVVPHPVMQRYWKEAVAEDALRASRRRGPAQVVPHPAMERCWKEAVAKDDLHSGDLARRRR